MGLGGLGGLLPALRGGFAGAEGRSAALGWLRLPRSGGHSAHVAKNDATASWAEARNAHYDVLEDV